MPTIEDVKNAVRRDWSGHSAAELCLSIADDIQRLGLVSAKYLSVERLLQISGKKFLDEEFLVALNILSACSPPLFQMGAYLLHENEEVDLNANEISTLIADNEVVHPITGQLVTEADEEVVVYYQASSKLTAEAG